MTTMIEVGRTIAKPVYDHESDRADLTEKWLSAFKDGADGVYALFNCEYELTGMDYSGHGCDGDPDDIRHEFVGLRVEYIGRTVYVGPDVVGRVWGPQFVRDMEREEDRKWEMAQ